MVAEVRHRARRGEGERLRGEILDAAEQWLVETADESAVSIRAIAGRVGVTPPSIYRHFADKDSLMMAVCQSVFARLDDALELAARDTTDPLDEIMRAARRGTRWRVRRWGGRVVLGGR
jgi:AcrR family transcriptional regulator